jgi:Spy/CpxP family protein refolding chaperone
MNKRLKLIGVTSVVLVAVLASTAHLSARPMGMYEEAYRAHHMMHKRGFGKPGHGEPMQAVWQLDLSEQQQAQLHALTQGKRKEFRERMRANQQARRVLHEAITAEPYDAERVKQLAQAQGGLRSPRRILKRAEMRQQIRALLTAEQLVELDKMRARPDCSDRAD